MNRCRGYAIPNLNSRLYAAHVSSDSVIKTLPGTIIAPFRRWGTRLKRLANCPRLAELAFKPEFVNPGA